MKKLIATTTGTVAYLATAIPAFAQARTGNICPGGAAGADFNALCDLTFEGGLIGMIITVIFVVAIVLALFYLIWGGIKWLLSGGDKAKVDAARQHIVAAIVGLVIIFLSYFVLSIIIPFFVPNFDFRNLTIPSIGN